VALWQLGDLERLRVLPNCQIAELPSCQFSGGFLDLAGSQAAGTYVEVAGSPFDQDVDTLDVRVASFRGDIVGVTDLGAELRALPADLASCCWHTKNPLSLPCWLLAVRSVEVY